MLYLAPSARRHACLLTDASQQQPRRSCSIWSSVDHVSSRVAISRCSASLPNCDASVQSSVGTKEAPVVVSPPKPTPRRGRPPKTPQQQQHTTPPPESRTPATPQPTTAPSTQAPSTPAPSRRGRPRKTPILPSQTAVMPDAAAAQTELVFVLERRGHGWGEEIIPHLVVEERPIAAKKSPVGVPAPWELGSLEQQLLDAGVAEDAVEGVVARAVSWRTTPGGRLLVDRRRRRRVERNMMVVVQHLIEYGVEAGPEGVGAVLTKAPELLLSKPTTNDRWDRRVVELAAFWAQHGHCDVPKTHTDPGLSSWVQRQRMVHAQGQLGSERVLILKALGFEFGEIAHMTADWERQFDALLDWVMWCEEQQLQMNWLGLDWGTRGGVAARQLALWVQMQREFRRRGLLGSDSIRRLETIGFRWNPPRSSAQDRHWLSQLGRVLYLVERWKVGANLPTPRSTVGVPPELAARGLGRRYRLQVALEQEVATRRAALQHLHLEPGLGFWIAKQRWLWRQGALDQERTLMLELAGIELSLAQCASNRIMNTPRGILTGNGSSITTSGGSQSMLWFAEAQRAAWALVNSGVRWPGAPQPTPINRVALRRWVWTQRALWCQGRLSTEQQRFLAVCGVMWVLSSEVLLMQAPAWQARYVALVSAMSHGVYNGRRSGGGSQHEHEQQGRGRFVDAGMTTMINKTTTSTTSTTSTTTIHCPVHAAAAHSSQLRDWLQHQKALRVLGMLSREREVQLSGLGLLWDLPPEPTQQAWDHAVSEMLAFEQRHGRAFDVEIDGRDDDGDDNRDGDGATTGVQGSDRQVSAAVNDAAMNDATQSSTADTHQPTQQPTDSSTTSTITMGEGDTAVAVCDAQARMLRRWVMRQQKRARKGELSSGKQGMLKLLGVHW